MNLLTILTNISHDEVVDARKQAGQLSRRGEPFARRPKQVIKKYPAIGEFLSLHAKPGHVLFTKEKIEGYTSACHLISTLAEGRENSAFQCELASITTEEMMAAVEDMLSTDKMAFAEWFRSCGQNYYGYVLGMWEEFLNLLTSGKNEQSIGHLIVVGCLIIIAENREGKSPRFPKP